MASITKTIIINAPIEKVFGLITDPERLAPFIPGVVQVAHVTLPLKPGSLFTWEYRFLGMSFRGDWVVEELRLPHLYLSNTKGGIHSRWMYTLMEKESMTLLTLDIDYGPPTSVLKRYMQSFIEPHMDKLAEAFFASLKTFLEPPADSATTPKKIKR